MGQQDGGGGQGQEGPLVAEGGAEEVHDQGHSRGEFPSREGDEDDDEEELRCRRHPETRPGGTSVRIRQVDDDGTDHRNDSSSAAAAATARAPGVDLLYALLGPTVLR